jgi:hypothetical protein
VWFTSTGGVGQSSSYLHGDAQSHGSVLGAFGHDETRLAMTHSTTLLAQHLEPISNNHVRLATPLSPLNNSLTGSKTLSLTLSISSAFSPSSGGKIISSPFTTSRTSASILNTVPPAYFPSWTSSSIACATSSTETRTEGRSAMENCAILSG